MSSWSPWWWRTHHTHKSFLLHLSLSLPLAVYIFFYLLFYRLSHYLLSNFSLNLASFRLYMFFNPSVIPSGGLHHIHLPRLWYQNCFYVPTHIGSRTRQPMSVSIEAMPSQWPWRWREHLLLNATQKLPVTHPSSSHEINSLSDK